MVSATYTECQKKEDKNFSAQEYNCQMLSNIICIIQNEPENGLTSIYMKLK